MNYLKDAESDNSVQAWTSEEWRAFLSEVEAEILDLRQKLAGLSPCKAIGPSSEIN
jgi:hypothetical protein